MEVFDDLTLPIKVMQYVHFSSGQVVYSDVPSISWDEFMATCPGVQASTADEARERHNAAARPPRPVARPYLQQLEKPAAKKKGRKRARSSSTSSFSSSDDDAREELSENERNAMLVYMQRYRDEFLTDYPQLADSWFCAPRGCPANVGDKGVLFDSIRSEGRGELARNFCRHFSLGVTFDCYYSEYGGKKNSSVICYGHHSKMCYLSGVWVEAGALRGFEFSAADLAGWREPDEFTALADGEYSSAKCRRRCKVVRDMAPSEWKD